MSRINRRLLVGCLTHTHMRHILVFNEALGVSACGFEHVFVKT